MKKIVKALAFCVSILSLSQADLISFHDLTELVSKDVKRNIFLDKDIKDYKMDLFIPEKLKQGEIYELYKNVLFEHDLKLQFNKRGKFYFVTKIPQSEMIPPKHNPYTKLHYYSYKIKNITNEDVVAVMKIFPAIKYSYLKQSDIIAYSATREQNSEIRRLLKTADNKVKSKTIKITIFTLNKNKLVSFGSKIAKLGFDAGYKVDNILSSLFSSSVRSFSMNDMLSFNFSLYAMQNYGIANIQQSPTMLITNGKQSLVNSVLNVPYLESTTTIKDNQSTTRDQIKYRDIGLVVNVNPKIKGDSVFLDLSLVSEELLSSKDNKPLTQKITYKNFVTVKKGHPVLLTGIRKKSVTYERDGVPVLSDLPLIGQLFKNRTKKDSQLSINIMIQLVDNTTKNYDAAYFGKQLKKSSSPVTSTKKRCTALEFLNRGGC